MMRTAVLLTVLTGTLLAAPAFAAAQTPVPLASGLTEHRVNASNLTNPGSRKAAPRVMNGQGCISGPMSNSGLTTVNPITGRSQAAPIVSIPLGNGSGSVASATTRAQQAHVCGHPVR